MNIFSGGATCTGRRADVNVLISSQSLMSRNTLKVLWVAFALVIGFVPSGRALAYEIRPEFAMFHDPEFDIPAEIKQLDERLLPLWRQVLLRPEADYQSQAAEAIAHAVESGFPGMEVAQ